MTNGTEICFREVMMVIRRIIPTAYKFLSTVHFRVVFLLFSFSFFLEDFTQPSLCCESKSLNNLRYRAFAFYINISWRWTTVHREVGEVWKDLPISGYPESLKFHKREQKAALIKKVTLDLAQKGKCLWNSFCPRCFVSFPASREKATVSESLPSSWLLAINPLVFASSRVLTACSGLHSFPSFSFLWEQTAFFVQIYIFCQDRDHQHLVGT